MEGAKQDPNAWQRQFVPGVIQSVKFWVWSWSVAVQCYLDVEQLTGEWVGVLVHLIVLFLVVFLQVS
jgi:hypothetical protein